MEDGLVAIQALLLSLGLDIFPLERVFVNIHRLCGGVVVVVRDHIGAACTSAYPSIEASLLLCGIGVSLMRGGTPQRALSLVLLLLPLLLSSAITLMAPIIVGLCWGGLGRCVTVTPDDGNSHWNCSDHDEQGHQADKSRFDFQSLEEKEIKPGGLSKRFVVIGRTL